jgi:hypothetical protein
MSWPDFRDYEYHAHRLVLHTAVIDSSGGYHFWPHHFGVRLTNCEFGRPGPGFNDFRFDFTDPHVWIDSLADPDTVDTFCIVHCAGLAEHLGGDTTHFARMDSRPGWEWSYRVSVNDYGYGEADEEFLLTLPDTVTPEVHLRVEVTLPLLYKWDLRGRRRINLDCLRIARIDVPGFEPRTLDDARFSSRSLLKDLPAEY